jgi:hypothetical protein
MAADLAREASQVETPILDGASAKESEDEN